MTEYRVKWEIDIDAATPLLAAWEAYRIQMDPGNLAKVFDVTDENNVTVQIDLDEDDNEHSQIFETLVEISGIVDFDICSNDVRGKTNSEILRMLSRHLKSVVAKQ